MQTWLPFDTYPVSGEQVRFVAEETQHRVQDVRDLVGQLDGYHQRALDGVDGTLQSSVADAPAAAQADASTVMETATFAAGCMEHFADAIDTFDSTSQSPRSVYKLNDAYLASLHINFTNYPMLGPVLPAGPGQPGYYPPYDPREPLPPSAPGPLGFPTGSFGFPGLPAAAVPFNFAGRQRCIDALTQEYNQLHANLDEAAHEVSAMLKRGPNVTDVTRLWSEGNLPLYASMVFPTMGLQPSALTALPPEYAGLTSDQMATVLAQLYTTNPALYSSLANLSPAAMSVLKQRLADWKLNYSNNVHDPKLAAQLYPWACGDPKQLTGGVITGPDGRQYPVVIPLPPPPCNGTCTRAGGMIQDGGSWQTVQSMTGDISLGHISPGLTLAFIAASTGGGSPVRTSDFDTVSGGQAKYLTTYPNGDVRITIDRGSSGGSEGSEPNSGSTGTEPLEPGEAIKGAAELTTSILHGISDAHQAENDKHYAYQVVFQQDANGTRRAVILLNQIQSDGKEVIVRQSYGRIDHDGHVVPAGG